MIANLSFVARNSEDLCSILHTLPELTATQSSWFLQTAPVIVTPVDDPMSKQSVL